MTLTLMFLPKGNFFLVLPCCCSFALNDADVFFLTENALYSPALTGATNTQLEGRGRAGVSLTEQGISVTITIFGVTISIISVLGGGGREEGAGKWTFCEKVGGKEWCQLSVYWLRWESGGIFFSSSSKTWSLIYDKWPSLLSQLSSSVWAAPPGKLIFFLFIFCSLRRTATLSLHVTFRLKTYTLLDGFIYYLFIE